ncbi:NADAR family protein_gp217 [Bacillus phage vB_BceM_WH1]|nr:NADAR family protein_gp217 [Bacillus phage vB_BceM_WH1]
MNYTFFWGGIFSQWHKSKFEVDGITFNCAEQYMMYQKALLFGDEEVAKKILTKSNPRDQKDLGRKVKGFVEETWNKHAKEIVYKGNYAKFTQNPELLKGLKATGQTLLVEASPHDDIWGIGLDEKTARKTPEKDWKGTNWLGEVLTNLRFNLIEEGK